MRWGVGEAGGVAGGSADFTTTISHKATATTARETREDLATITMRRRSWWNRDDTRQPDRRTATDRTTSVTSLTSLTGRQQGLRCDLSAPD